MTATLMAERLGDRLESGLATLATIVDEIDASSMHGDDARRMAELFAQGVRLCEAGLLATAAQVASTGAWRGSGEASAENWMAKTTGRSSSAGRRTMETAKRVARQPEVAARLQSGALSSEQVEEISAAVERVPTAATGLLDQAERDPSVGALRAACRDVRAEAASAEEERAQIARIHRERYLRSWTDSDGAGRLDARMTADALARFEALLSPFEDQVFHEARKDERRERFDAYSLDALLTMAAVANPSTDAERLGAVDATDEGVSGCDADEASGAGSASPAGHRRPPATVLLRADLSALRRGWVTTGEQCEIDGIGPVPVAVLREWMHDAFMALVVTDGVDIRSVVHLGRFPTAAQRTALTVRDPACVVPGCHVRDRLEIDHVDPWTATHVTTLDRLARLCHRHHQMKTYDGWRLGGEAGAWTWEPPRSDTRSGAPPSDSSGDRRPIAPRLLDGWSAAEHEDPFPPP